MRNYTSFPRVADMREAFNLRVDKSAGPDECWVWIGSRNTAGYGRMNYNCKHHAAHRLSWEFHVGPIPEGLVIDHLCRNTSCVNPNHLEPVTDRVNILRGTAPTAEAARKTHCPKGHAYEGDNLKTYKTYRMCATCKKDQAREHYRRVRNTPPNKWRVAS